MVGEKKKILSFWQDKRLCRVCHVLTAAGYEIGIAGCTLPAGMPREVGLFPNWRERLPEYDVILLPLPTLTSGDVIAFREAEIPFSELLGCLKRGTVLLVGMLPEALVREAEAMGMTVCDYYNAEKVRQRNGELTAEGAISIAMQELPIAMDEVNAAVVGCGRIGTALCKKLRAMGASVTAVSRSRSSLVEAEQCGCAVKQMNDDVLRGLLQGYDVVFTTVPHRVFHSEILRSYAPLTCGRGTLFVDLSSSPGSFDAASARENGIHLLWALSLPGKYAPDSAGAVLAEQMLALLSMYTAQKEELI